MERLSDTAIITLTVFTLIFLLVLTAFVVFSLTFKYMDRKRERKDEDDKSRKFFEQLDYSKEVLEYVRNICSQIVVLRFKEFLDEHQLEKVTREKFKNVVEKITTEIGSSIKLDKFDFDQLLFDRLFVETYIVQSSITMCKKMLNDTLIDIVEE